jgi:hypothetical protein
VNRQADENAWENGKFRLDYLNTNYTFNGAIESVKDSLKLKNITLKDRFGNNGTLSGMIVFFSRES